MSPADRWKILLEKAAQDEYTVDQLIPLPDSPDEVIGFHLQQAAEKLLKSLLSFRAVAYRPTHNLGELIRLLETHGEPLPTTLDHLRDLTPYATEWRYDYLPLEGETSLDRNNARQGLHQLRNWVEARLQK